MNENDFEKEKKINDTTDEYSEVKHDNEDEKNIQGSEEKGEQINQEKEQADENKKENNDEEVKATQKEEHTASEVGQGSNVNSHRAYSASYTPPNYIPNFTVIGDNSSQSYTGSASDNKSESEKKQKRFSNGIILALCAATLVLSLILGTLSGAIMSGLFAFSPFGAGSELVNIISSDREITVEELPGNTGYSDLTVAQVAALVGESVVEITTTHVQTSVGYGQYVTSGAGSGVIFDQKGTTGYIVTNYHVIEGANDITVRVKTGDGYNEYQATYIAGDSAEDIAVIRITTASDHVLKKAVFADSDKIIVGEEVVAIGNPLGQLGGTVTDGIISALDREIIIDNNTMRLLQTNTAINPGNSGGGLFNMAGELVGIVNAKQSSTGIEGLGFAIPANIVKKDINDVLEYGYITGRITLGITVQYGTLGGVDGIFVTATTNNSFRTGDRIVKINDVEINNLSEFNTEVKKLTIGDSVSIQIVRTKGFGSEQMLITTTAQEDKSK